MEGARCLHARACCVCCVAAGCELVRACGGVPGNLHVCQHRHHPHHAGPHQLPVRPAPHSKACRHPGGELRQAARRGEARVRSGQRTHGGLAGWHKQGGGLAGWDDGMGACMCSLHYPSEGQHAGCCQRWVVERSVLPIKGGLGERVAWGKGLVPLPPWTSLDLSGPQLRQAWPTYPSPLMLAC